MRLFYEMRVDFWYWVAYLLDAVASWALRRAHRMNRRLLNDRRVAED